MGERDVDPTFLEVAVLVVDIAREMQLRAASSTPVVPLTQTQGQVMRFVHDHPGCSASDIADGSGLQRANVSTALRELRGRGYLTSQRDDADGRAIRIDATPLADATILALRASWASLIADAWGPTTEGTALDDLAGDLVRIRDGLRAGRATKGLPIDPPGAGGAEPDSEARPRNAEGPIHVD